jgi:hypothetical protein
MLIQNEILVPPIQPEQLAVIGPRESASGLTDYDAIQIVGKNVDPWAGGLYISNDERPSFFIKVSVGITVSTILAVIIDGVCTGNTIQHKKLFYKSNRPLNPISTPIFATFSWLELMYLGQCLLLVRHLCMKSESPTFRAPTAAP